MKSIFVRRHFLNQKMEFLWLITFSLTLGFQACEDIETLPNGEDVRTPWLGEWLCTESPYKASENAYIVNITIDPDNSAQVKLYNYFQLGEDVAPYAVVTSSTITVPQQQVSGGSWTVSGFGKMSKDEIVWSSYRANELSFKATFRRP
jgi:hypothetical protein